MIGKPGGQNLEDLGIDGTIKMHHKVRTFDYLNYYNHLEKAL